MILSAFVAFTYPVAIQSKRKGPWLVLLPLTLLVWLVDVVANYTEWAIVFGWPKKGDRTITARLKSMQADPLESRRAWAQLVQVYLDACEPDGRH